jgi:hypothetical protein
VNNFVLADRIGYQLKEDDNRWISSSHPSHVSV